ncbi:MAG: thioredoxin family protein [Acidobacteria bacterium]|nr:thioredoxin family protein [Acidobacteriota bacterium]
MQRFLWLFFSLSVWAMGPSHVDVQLLSNASPIAKGQPFWLGIQLTMREHWHTYWENPGSSGLPTTVEWQPVEGLQIGALQFPIPQKFVDDAGFITYGYDNQVLLLAKAVYSGDANSLSIQGKVDWLECKELCIPGSAPVQLNLTIGEVSLQNEKLFSETLQKVPVDWSPDAPFAYDFAIQYGADQWKGQLQLQAKQGDISANPQLFPGLNPHAELTSIQWNPAGKGLTGNLTFNAWDEKPADDFVHTAVLVWESADGTQPYRLVLAPTKKQAAAPIAPDSGTPAKSGLLFILLIAFIGGLILNLMPCVLPVLSLKILSFIKEAGSHQGRRMVLSLAYTVGILVCMEVLAVTIMITKMGVGGQFSLPGFNLGMAVLLLVMSLSFFNVFEFGTPNVGGLSQLNRKSGLQGAFFQGVLMTILSTPCSAPFLGTAYAWTLTATNFEVILVFFMIGLGLAAPYVVLTSLPSLMKFMPKPGPWMETFKTFMGFPLLATVVWLLSILAAQTGRSGLIGVMTFLLFVALAVWLFGQGQKAERKMGTWLAAALILGFGTWFSLFKLWDIRNPMADLNREKEEIYLSFLAERGGSEDVMALLESKKTTNEELAWIPYSADALKHFRAKGRLVFMDFTAEWCATCKANEKFVVDTETIRAAFTKYDVVTMKVDYTNQPAEITELLKSFNRAGVPLYLFYPGEGQALVLPETITQRMVLDALENAQAALTQRTRLNQPE